MMNPPPPQQQQQQQQQQERLQLQQQPQKKTAYKNQAKKFLENYFPRISCAAINAVLNHVNFYFTDAFRILSEIQQANNNNDNENNNNIANVFPHMPSKINKVFLKHERIKKRVRIHDPLLLEEINAIPILNTKENDPPALADDDDVNEAVVEEKDGAAKRILLVECGCCYGDYPPQNMKECNGNVGHKVCKDCLYRYVGEQLDGNNSIQFQCIVNAECCEIYPTATVLDDVLSPGLKRRTNDAIFRSVVGQAKVDGVWTCPKCAYIGYLDQPYPTVNCPKCNVTYCTACDRAAHSKKTCQEVQAEEERLKNPIHLAHEKMSQATIRRCPSCLISFLKHDGCNKMTCKTPGCNTKSCYLCGVKVKDYSHFCNHNRGKPCPACEKTCELWTNTEAMKRRDRKARRKAGRQVLEDAGMSPEEIKRILASPPEKKERPKKKKAPPAPQQQAGPIAAAPLNNGPPAQPPGQQDPLIAPPVDNNVPEQQQVQPPAPQLEQEAVNNNDGAAGLNAPVNDNDQEQQADPHEPPAPQQEALNNNVPEQQDDPVEPPPAPQPEQQALNNGDRRGQRHCVIL